jgi:hypothetical protein
MAFANPNYTDMVVTTLVKQNKKLADNITGNNALLKMLEMGDRIKEFTGGRVIVEELLQAESSNAQWYAGADVLPTGNYDAISGAEFSLKQAACPILLTGIEETQNSGEEALIDLLDGRKQGAEATIANLISAGLYSDGTGAGSKQITGLLATAPLDPTTGTYGGINRATATNAFWRSYARDTNAAPSSTTIQGIINTAFASLTRGSDKPNLLTMDDDVFGAFEASLQTNQRFTESKLADLGFNAVRYKGAEVVMDSGIGGDHTNVTCFLLNTKYLKWRTAKGKYMTPLKARSPYNQDVSVTILVAYCQLTCSGAQFQGQIVFS